MLEQLDLPCGIAGILLIAFFCVLVPLGAWKSGRTISTRPLPTRVAYLRAVVLQHTFFLLLALLVAHAEDVELFPGFTPSWTQAAAGAAALAFLVALNWRNQEAKVRRGERRIALVSPRTPLEYGLWGLVSLLAGVIEEILYRAELTTLWWRITGSATAAVAIAVVAFGLGHLHQGWKGALVTGTFALVFHALVGWAQTLVLAMAVHFVYDVIAGVRYSWLVRRLGYVPHEPPAPAPG